MREINPNLPVDSVATRVVAKTTHHGVDFSSGHKITSMSPLPIKQFLGRRIDDLTGRKFGTFVVIGCSLWMPKNWRTSTNSTRWVGRCKCGRYQIFTTKAVKKNHPKTSCVDCQRLNSKKYKNQ